jgi:hypothetical protein
VAWRNRTAKVGGSAAVVGGQGGISAVAPSSPNGVHPASRWCGWGDRADGQHLDSWADFSPVGEGLSATLGKRSFPQRTYARSGKDHQMGSLGFRAAMPEELRQCNLAV